MQSHSNETAGHEYAGFWVRLAAYAIDMVIVTMGLLIVRLVFIGINSLIAGTFLEGGILFHYTLKDIVLYLLQVIYFILFTYYTGTTLGKRALNLRVIRTGNEEKLSLFTVIYRETIGRFLCGVLLCVGYLLVGVDKEKRGLHDILCDTRVIYAKKVKVYPVYQGNVMKADSTGETNSDDYLPSMVEEMTESKEQEKTLEYSYAEEDIQAQWNSILERNS